MKVFKTILALLYISVIALLAYATFVEQAEGVAYVSQHIYHTAWFFLLWSVLAVAAFIYMAKRGLFRQFSLCLLHCSFIIILAGAATTFLFGEEGKLHLRQGKTATTFEGDNGQPVAMPLSIKLNKFEVVNYPGTETPQDFVSHLSVADLQAGTPAETVSVSMNNILSTHGYRFYQSSFDMDMRGTVLSVNHDPVGTAVTYIGYLLFGLAVFLTLLSRRGEFRRLLASPSLRRTAFLFAILLSATTSSARSIPTVNAEKAERVARVQVVYNGRIVPLNTVALDFIQKIYGRSSYKGLTAEQVIYGWMLRPDVWAGEQMIKIKSAALRRQLGIEGKYASMQQLFDANGQYKLLSLMQQGGSQSEAKSLRELDEKAGLILMLANRTLFTPLKPTQPHLSDSRVEAEILYNRIPFTKVLFMVNLTMGFLTFFLLLFLSHGTKARPRKLMHRGGIIILCLSFLFALFGYILRWYIGGRVPLSNGYETMLFLALALMLITLLLSRRFSYILPFGFLLSGFALLVSHLGQMNPQITPLMPVLHSPLLSIHVSVIMVAYALFAFMTLDSIYACILLRQKHPSAQTTQQIEQLTTLNRLMLYAATFLLGIGIFLGAVWANVSWGKYWSWDPKENWALITLMVYAVAFHHRSLPFLNRKAYYHLYIILAFLTVLMTYFGVNYFLGGMHSYA